MRHVHDAATAKLIPMTYSETVTNPVRKDGKGVEVK